MGKRTKTQTATDQQTTSWEVLTWDDLTEWAGGRSVSRGRSYQRQKQVDELVISADGQLLATVIGGRRYITRVWTTSESPRGCMVQSSCSCPVGYDGCKHAVAVVAEYLDRLANGEEVPTAEEDDPRLAGLQTEDFDLDENTHDMRDFDAATSPQGSRKKSAGRKDIDWNRKIEEHIRAKSREDLADLVISLTERFSELKKEFQERISLSEGNADQLISDARRQMRDLTAEPGWWNSWEGNGFIPDYSGFRHRLERLVELGHADAVAQLGREFVPLAMEQVGQSQDEGETGMAVAACLPIIVTAVLQSGLSPAEQILFAIELHLQDDYGFIDDSATPIFEGDWTQADWADVAESLQQRLENEPCDSDNSFSRNYGRDQISGWLLSAMDHAGRSGEMRDIYEAEARQTGSYSRLVRYLIDRGEIDDARGWAIVGIEQTRDQWPGIAKDLAGLLKDMARDEKQWDFVAADAACRFFERPSASGFEELVQAARKAKCVRAVKQAALHFLQTGELPFRRIPQGKGKNRTFRLEPLPDWPLPMPDYLASFLANEQKSRTWHNVLLEMALAAKQPDQVLHWYDMLTGDRSSLTGSLKRHYSTPYADQVAAAVVKSHPERALEIYVDQLNANLGPASPSAYDRAATCLKKMRPILKSLGREQEWEELVKKLRTEYKRRRLFIEQLDRLEGQTIIESQKKKK